MTARIRYKCEDHELPRLCARRLIRIENVRKLQKINRSDFSDLIFDATGRRYTARRIAYAERTPSGTHKLGDNYLYLTDAANVLRIPVQQLISIPPHAYPDHCPYCTRHGRNQYCLICGRSYR